MAQTLKDMLQNGIKDLEELENLGKNLKSVKTSQIRKFFGALRKIQADYKNQQHDILMLEPRLAYAKGKAKGESQAGLEKLYRALSPLIIELKPISTTNEEERKKKFDSFVRIVEGIVAYHKYHGGVE